MELELQIDTSLQREQLNHTLFSRRFADTFQLYNHRLQDGIPQSPANIIPDCDDMPENRIEENCFLLLQAIESFVAQHIIPAFLIKTHQCRLTIKLNIE